MKTNLVPDEVMRGENTPIRGFIKRFIKRHKKLHAVVYKLLHCNLTVYRFRMRNLDTDALFNSIGIETCSACNRRCPFCPLAQDKGPMGLMDDKLFDKILKELKELGFKGDVAFSNYGEPLLDKRLVSFAKKVKEELGSRTIISTNGDFLTPERFMELVPYMDLFHVAQHDMEPSEAVRNLFAKIDKKYWKHIGYEVVRDDAVTLNNRAGSVNVKTQYPFYCAPGRMIIRWDGRACMCCNDYWNEVALGNANTEKLIDIWNKPFYRKIRSEIKRGVFNLNLCKKCLGKKV